MLKDSALTFKESVDYSSGQSSQISQQVSQIIPVFGNGEEIKQTHFSDTKKDEGSINDSNTHSFQLETQNQRAINSLNSNIEESKDSIQNPLDSQSRNNSSPQIKLSQYEEVEEKTNRQSIEIVQKSRVRLRVPSYIEVGNPMLESPRFDQTLDPVIRARVQTININSPRNEQLLQNSSVNNRFQNRLRIPSTTEVGNPMMEDSTQNTDQILQETIRVQTINQTLSPQNKQYYPEIKLSQPYCNDDNYQSVKNPMFEQSLVIQEPITRNRVQTINIGSPVNDDKKGKNLFENTEKQQNRLRVPSTISVGNPMMEESFQNSFFDQPQIKLSTPLEDQKNEDNRSITRIRVQTITIPSNEQKKNSIIDQSRNRLRVPSTISVGNPMIEDSIVQSTFNYQDEFQSPLIRQRVQTINLPEVQNIITMNEQDELESNISQRDQDEQQDNLIEKTEVQQKNRLRKQFTVPEDMFVANPLDSPSDSVQLYMSTAPRVLTTSVLKDQCDLSLNSSPDSNNMYNVPSLTQMRFTVIPEDEVQSVLLNSQTTLTQNLKINDHGASSQDSENSCLVKRFSPPHRRVTQDINSNKRTSLGVGKSMRLSKNNTQGRMSYSPQPQINFNINEMSEQESHYQKTISSSQMSIQQHAEELVRIIRSYLQELSFTMNEYSLHRSFSFDKNLTSQDGGMKSSSNYCQELKQQILKRMINLIQDSEMITPNNQQSPKFEPSFIGSFMAKKDQENLNNLDQSFKPTHLGDSVTENFKLKQQIEGLQSRQVILETRMMEYYNNEQEYKSKFQESQKNLCEMIDGNSKLQQRIKAMQEENDQEFEEIQNKLLEFSVKYKELETECLSKIEQEKILNQLVKEKEDEIIKLQSQYLEMSKRQTEQFSSNSKISENKSNGFSNKNASNKTLQHNYLKVNETIYLREKAVSHDKGKSVDQTSTCCQNSVLDKLNRVTPSPQRATTRNSPYINIQNHIHIENTNFNNDIQLHERVLNGRNRQYYSNGMIYQGGFLNNKREGFGVLKLNNQDIYTGTWHNDLKHGTGHLKNIFIKSNETIDYTDLSSVKSWVSYQGEFKKDKFDGFGVLQFFNNEKYQGEFQEGHPNGKGTYYTNTGQSLHSIWMNGVMVRIL